AIEDIPRRRWWSEVAARMQRHAEDAGYSVVQQYVGHGIGRVMHENPQVPNFISRELRKHDFRLEPGLVLAVEPMVNMGKADTRRGAARGRVVPEAALPGPHVDHPRPPPPGATRPPPAAGDPAPPPPAPALASGECQPPG